MESNLLPKNQTVTSTLWAGVIGTINHMMVSKSYLEITADELIIHKNDNPQSAIKLRIPVTAVKGVKMPTASWIEVFITGYKGFKITYELSDGNKKSVNIWPAKLHSFPRCMLDNQQMPVFTKVLGDLLKFDPAQAVNINYDTKNFAILLGIEFVGILLFGWLGIFMFAIAGYAVTKILAAKNLSTMAKAMLSVAVLVGACILLVIINLILLYIRNASLS